MLILIKQWGRPLPSLFWIPPNTRTTVRLLKRALVLFALVMQARRKGDRRSGGWVCPLFLSNSSINCRLPIYPDSLICGVYRGRRSRRWQISGYLGNIPLLVTRAYCSDCFKLLNGAVAADKYRGSGFADVRNSEKLRSDLRKSPYLREYMILLQALSKKNGKPYWFQISVCAIITIGTK